MQKRCMGLLVLLDNKNKRTKRILRQNNKRTKKCLSHLLFCLKRKRYSVTMSFHLTGRNLFSFHATMTMTTIRATIPIQISPFCHHPSGFSTYSVTG